MDENGQAVEIAPSMTHSAFLRIALRVLGMRAARWVTLLMSFTLFGAAVWWPSWARLAAAGAFTVLVFLPAWFKKEARNA